MVEELMFCAWEDGALDMGKRTELGTGWDEFESEAHRIRMDGE
jgi:hypothetical protein